jgi:hypothetical protein
VSTDDTSIRTVHEAGDPRAAHLAELNDAVAAFGGLHTRIVRPRSGMPVLRVVNAGASSLSDG